MSAPKLKRCPKCPSLKPAREFYRRTLSRDGLSRLCKIHQKEAKRGYYREIKRKECVMSHPSPKEAVRRAIEQGARNQHEIRKATRLTDDQITDELAQLWDSNLLDRTALRNGRYQLKVAA